MGRPAVTGAASVEIDLHARLVRIGDLVLHEGDLIGIDGSTGAVTLDDVPLVAPRVDQRFETVLGWCDELRTLGVRANADTPEDAARAHAFGGRASACAAPSTCSWPRSASRMQRMIMADDEATRREALDELLPLQQRDFEGLLEAMSGLPVTIRLLDPPLHGSCRTGSSLSSRSPRRGHRRPGRDALQALERVRAAVRGQPDARYARGAPRPDPPRDLRDAGARDLPRGGTVRERGHAPARLEVMVPLVAYPRELELCAGMIERVAAEEGFPRNAFQIGTMIELPRACLRAGEIAAFAEFFSFNNDLTQTALGFSRDDIEGAIVPSYVDSGILGNSPFGSVDEHGVGELVRIAAQRGRAARAGIELGVCGEAGGTRSRSASSTPRGSTTSAARRSGSRSPASRRRERR